MELTRPIVFLDTETTGVHPSIDRIVEIGLVKVYPDGTETEWQSYVNPGIPIPKESTEIHGITDDMIQDAPPFRSQLIYGSLLNGLRDCDVGGFNVRFDLRMIKEESLRNHVLPPEWGQIVDSQRIYHRLMRRNLIAAAKEFLGEDFSESAHGSMADSRMSLRVLRAQLERHTELPRTVPELAAWIDAPEGTGSVDPDNKLAYRHGHIVINFGQKALGQRLDHADAGFLSWMLKGDFSEKVLNLVRDELKRRKAL